MANRALKPIIYLPIYFYFFIFCTILVLGCNTYIPQNSQSSGAVWKSRWPSWAFRPNEPCCFCGRKAIFNHAHALVTVCPWYVNRHPRTWRCTSWSSAATHRGDYWGENEHLYRTVPRTTQDHKLFNNVGIHASRHTVCWCTARMERHQDKFLCTF